MKRKIKDILLTNSHKIEIVFTIFIAVISLITALNSIIPFFNKLETKVIEGTALVTTTKVYCSLLENCLSLNHASTLISVILCFSQIPLSIATLIYNKNTSKLFFLNSYIFLFSEIMMFFSFAIGGQNLTIY